MSKGKKKGGLSTDDEALWQAFSQDVSPLNKSKSASNVPPPPNKPVPSRKREKMEDVPPAALTPSGVRDKYAPTRKSMAAATSLDGARARRLKKGQLPIEGRVDLHGMTQEQAHRRLNKFLAHAQADGKRCVLVITGKGGTEVPDPDNIYRMRRTGVLRHVVPQWLAQGDNARRVLAWHPARPNHGGDGALYVVLKRIR